MSGFPASHKMKIPKISRKRPYICSYCAQKKGGIWPEGHCATIHIGKCDYCKKEKSLASIGDYNWDKQSFLDMRD